MALLAAILLALLAGAQAYVRLAPLPGWALDRRTPLTPLNSHRVTLRPADPAAEMARLDRIIRASPRTRVLAGSPAGGAVSYVTRSLVWGFPDVSHLWREGEALHLQGRSVFGRGDHGVNRQRLETWLWAL